MRWCSDATRSFLSSCTSMIARRLHRPRARARRVTHTRAGRAARSGAVFGAQRRSVWCGTAPCGRARGVAHDSSSTCSRAAA
eukprot:3349207-Prymnesium_polylepis.3